MIDERLDIRRGQVEPDQPVAAAVVGAGGVGVLGTIRAEQRVPYEARRPR